LGFVAGIVYSDPRPLVARAQSSTFAQASKDDGKLRVIIFGAHPDDAEYRGAGVAMKWARLGHHVKLVSATNGDIGHYHPDHRYTSILVQDSAYMVGVPFFTDVPPLKKNPVFLYTWDHFQRPNPFRADAAVGIDDVMDPTLDALLLMESQIQEGGADGNASLYPMGDEAARRRRLDEVRKNLADRYAMQADKYRDALVEFYGEQRARGVRYAQAFEVCEYGRQPSREELKQIFPF
jgi:LmbE family N-acetylglucosaminyl deacetylase